MRVRSSVGLFAACAIVAACKPAADKPATSSPDRQIVDIPAAQVATNAPLTATAEPVRPDGPSPPKNAVDAYLACRDQSRQAPNVAMSASKGTYLDALASELGGDVQTARRRYLGVIQSAPGAPIIPYAYLAFGLMFANEADADPSKWAFVEQSMQEVLKYQSDVAPIAHVELTRAFGSMGEHEKALAELSKLFRSPGTEPCTEVSRAVGKSMLVRSFAQVGDPTKASMFFRSLVGPNDIDPMLDALRSELGSTGHAKEAAAVR